MRNSITSPNIRLDDELRRIAERRLNVVLGRISARIDRVSITLTDANGLRGGVDKHCRVKVKVRGVGIITTEGRHENVLASIEKALRLIVPRNSCLHCYASASWQHCYRSGLDLICCE